MNLNRLIPVISTSIQLLATVAVLVHAGRALVALARGKGIDHARLLLAEEVLSALGFFLAATLLNVIGLGNWTQIRTFTVIFVLRTVLKQVFLRERKAALALHGS